MFSISRYFFAERFLPLLRRYFYSGWAFLIPYLAVYLLYYITKWPVNPVRSSEHLVASSQHEWVPSMLHVYWLLHAIHVMGAGFALWSWWASFRSKYQAPSAKTQGPSAPHLPPTNYQLPSTSYQLLVRIAPWALLALIFYIPGVYLEWPSDPWEHLRRINEWRVLDTVGAHSSWYKTSYFIPYSFLSGCIGLRQLYWLDYYYTGICLLLCWQYYRLSRACGLGERASMVFVIIQALLFGNNIFSFYRYYGISSSIYAQIGAIATIRIFIESPLNFMPMAWALRCQIADKKKAGSLILLLPTYFFLIAFTALNHMQGIIIIFIGISSISAYRASRRQHLSMFTLIILFNLLFLLFLTKSPLLDDLREKGWLFKWYGFSVLNLRSIAGDRMIQIIGSFGILNLIAAAFLATRREIVAWITLSPIFFLVIPITGASFAYLLSDHYANGSGIVTFHRVFFVIPPYLALIKLFTIFRPKIDRYIHLATPVFCILFFAVLSLPPNQPSPWGRLWNSVYRVPSDLRLEPQFVEAARYSKSRLRTAEVIFQGTPIVAAIHSGNPLFTPIRNLAQIGEFAFAQDLERLETYLSAPGCRKTRDTLVFSPIIAFSFRSFAAQFSSHWSSPYLPLCIAGTKELIPIATASGLSPNSFQGGVLFSASGPATF